MYSTYCRLNVHVLASDITVIREVRKKLRVEVLWDRDARERRHKIYKLILAEHKDARELYLGVTRGI